MIVLEERRHSATGAKTRHEFSLTFDASTAQLLSPTAHIIVWCVTQTGEIVSDSLEVSVDAAFANEVSPLLLCSLITVIHISVPSIAVSVLTLLVGR